MAETCFVIMGFGKKTDYGETTRTLDLDATYDAIIKPAVRACGLQCIRADEISHSGIIDKPMYQMLLQADLVIADISTANPNALYELGVRHALKPYSTIVMKEIDGKFHFDLNHLATLQYKHLGEDIGAKEARTKSAALKTLIEAVLANPQPDSPVYTFLDGLNGPTLTKAEMKAAVDEARAQSESLAEAISAGRRAASESKSAEARDHFARACAMQRDARANANGDAPSPDAFLIQQLALHTYKAGAKATFPERIAALRDGWKVLEELVPASSTDPETLGIAGAIQRRLFQESKDPSHIDAAIDLYGRGFELKRDYYNGENYARCIDMRAEIQTDPAEAEYDRRTAAKVRRRVVETLEKALTEEHTKERSDYHWMLATMANTLWAIGQDGELWESAFREMKPRTWELETFEEGKRAALELARRGAKG